MRKIVNFAIKYPVTVTMMVLAILLLGKISYDRLGVDLFPSLETPKLFIEITTTDKPPTEVESQVVEKIEASAIRASGAKSVTSDVRANGALITVEYLWGEDMDNAFLELQSSMTSFGSNEDIEEIIVSQLDPSAEPIVKLALSHSELGIVDLTRIANNYVRSQLLSVDGVADVSFSGDLDVEVVVATNPYKLAAFSLTTNQIATKINDNNYRVSGGRIEENGSRYIVNGSNILENIEAFNTIIVSYVDGKAIYLKDVADVYIADKKPESIIRLGGEECVGIEIYKESDYNTLKATNGVLAEVERLRQAMPQYDIVVVGNQGEFIERSIGDVQSSAVLGMLLAIVVLFVFLRRVGTTIIISLAIPISIIATFNMFYFGGLTLNIMTLGGLALGAGMLVDNAIVVIENIFRHHEQGKPLTEAIVDGTSQVGGAIIASTLTTIVVFFPIVYIQGQSGSLFREQAWSVTFALVSSLFVAIIAIPVMYSKLIRSTHGESETKSETKSLRITWYGDILNKILAKRYMVVTIAAIFVVVVGLLFSTLGSEFMPSSNSKNISMDIELEGGATLNRTRSTVKSIESVISQLAGEDVVIYSECGVVLSDGSTTPQSNLATVDVILDENSLITAPNLIEELNAYLSNIPALSVTYHSSEDAVSSLFDSDQGDIIVEIKGDDLAKLSKLQGDVIAGIENIEGIDDLIYQSTTGEKEVTIFVDRVATSIYGFTLQNVINQIDELLNGADAGVMEYQGDMSDIRVTMPEVALSELGNIEISQNGVRILLRDIATIEYADSPIEIKRIDQSRVMQVAVMCNSDVALSRVADNIRKQIAQIETPDNYYISIEGSEREREESFNSMIFALILSIVLVYMVMASQFESLLHPFTILLTIPMAVAGAILLFVVTGVNLNIMAAIGMVMLVGIAVNSSILLVDRIGQLRGDGYELHEAIVASAEQRIRPILMTSITTILALLPMALSAADGAEFQRPMAIAVIGGLVASTILSLTVIPCLYWVFEELKSVVLRRKRDE